MDQPAPPDQARHPYQALTPDVVLDALASVGLVGDGRLTALGSYENRVYQVHLDTPLDGKAVVVAKFYRPGRWSEAAIREEHRFAADLTEAEIPVVAPLLLKGSSLHRWQDFWFSVSPWRGGRRPELDDFEVLEWIGRFLARIHTVGSTHPFVSRPALDLSSFAKEPRDWLLQANNLPPEVRSTWGDTCQIAIDFIASNHLLALDNGNFSAHIRLHGDCHPGNILWTPSDRPDPGPHFVDLDDARQGPAVQDFWMLLSGNRRQQSAQLAALLDGYEQYRAFDRRELALIEPLRTMRLIHYSYWLARRWSDPIFPINFPWFGSPDYWRGQIQTLRDQIEAMQRPPLSCG